MKKKYIIELNERQMRLLSWALDTLPRLIEGQDHSFQDLLEQAWEKRCKKATGKMMDDTWDGGWHQMRQDAEETCLEIKRRFWGLPPNTLNGLHYDNTADILWDMYQVIRHQLWLDREDPDKPRYTVDASPAVQFGDEPLIVVKPKKQKK